jgi:hypothetical protein
MVTVVVIVTLLIVALMLLVALGLRADVAATMLAVVVVVACKDEDAGVGAVRRCGAGMKQSIGAERLDGACGNRKKYADSRCRGKQSQGGFHDWVSCG